MLTGDFGNRFAVHLSTSKTDGRCLIPWANPYLSPAGNTGLPVGPQCPSFAMPFSPLSFAQTLKCCHNQKHHINTRSLIVLQKHKIIIVLKILV